MARFNMQESENYGASKNNYFALKDDKDTAIIRFLYNDIIQSYYNLIIYFCQLYCR